MRLLLLTGARSTHEFDHDEFCGQLRLSGHEVVRGYSLGDGTTTAPKAFEPGFLIDPASEPLVAFDAVLLFGSPSVLVDHDIWWWYVRSGGVLISAGPHLVEVSESTRPFDEALRGLFGAQIRTQDGEADLFDRLVVFERDMQIEPARSAWGASSRFVLTEGVLLDARTATTLVRWPNQHAEPTVDGLRWFGYPVATSKAAEGGYSILIGGDGFSSRYYQPIPSIESCNGGYVRTYVEPVGEGNGEWLLQVLVHYTGKVRNRLGRSPNARRSTAELLALDPESGRVEFKARVRADRGEPSWRDKNRTTYTNLAESVAGLANSHSGGTILIGVDDHGIPVGLDSDYATFDGQNKNDQFELALSAALRERLDPWTDLLYDVKFETAPMASGGVTVCRVDVPPAAEPVLVRSKKGDLEFRVRDGAANPPLFGGKRDNYISRRFPTTRGA